MADSTTLSPATTETARRLHEMDALRAFAMLLGIALHASESFAPLPWLVQDSRQHGAFGLFVAAVHGFRMPLFFLVSGFFTAMLWRKRGIPAMLKQRTQRIFLPLLLGLVTIIPVTLGVSVWAMRLPGGSVPDDGTLIGAIRTADQTAVARRLERGADVNAPDPALGVTPLAWASLRGDVETARLLIERGADVNGRSADGSTPLHSAAFLGQAEVAGLLIEKGADLSARAQGGETPWKAAEVDWELTRYLAGGILRLPVANEAVVQQGRAQVRSLIEQRLSSTATEPSADTPRGSPRGSLLEGYRDALASDRLQVRVGESTFHLVQSPVFNHLWFLWFLCWLVPLFAVCAWVVDRKGGGKAPAWLTVSPLRLLWWIPGTLVPEFFMGYGGPHFGADTATGLLLPPHLLLYYGIFFGFGALYHDADDDEGRLGRRWWLWLPVAIVLLLPAALATMALRPAGGVVQVLYTWAMVLGLIGLFRRYLSRGSAAIRYVSDSSYWLYLAHLPLVIALQVLVRDWPMPAMLKFLLVCTLATVILLLSYQLLVRHTWVGRLLNGRRGDRPFPSDASALPSIGRSHDPESGEHSLTRNQR